MSEKKRSSTALPPADSVDQLVRRLQTDPLLRSRLLSRLAETFLELGVKADDISLIPPLDVISGDFGGGSPAQIVIVSQSDAKKNTKSIIIGGGKGNK